MTTRAVLFAALFLPLAASAQPQPQPRADTGPDRTDYDRYCGWCHGESGNGRGPSARRLDSAPTDFTGGAFRCRSTPSGTLPTDDDLRRIIVRGVPGTAMPGFATLSPQQVDAILATMKTFSPAWKEQRAATPISIPADTARDQASIDRGAALYSKLHCSGCHGKTGHGDGGQATSLEDDHGQPIHAADLTKRGNLKCGDSTTRLYTTIMTGLNGTPMKAYDGQVAPGEAWDLVHFVETLH